MPDAVLADHLLGGVDGVSAAAASLTRGSLRSRVGLGFAVDQGGCAVSRDKGRGVAVAEALGPEEFAVAGAAMDLPVGAIASQS